MKQKKLDFIKKRIKKLDEKIIPLIFIEIINIYINENDKDDKKKRKNIL